MKNAIKLGIDVGRVIIRPDDADGADTSFIGGSLEDALRTPPFAGMFDVVPRLVDAFEGRVWIVSKCGPSVQNKTLRWFDHHRFFQRTGIPRDNVRFCLRRPEKAIHCRELGITHFIDDRIDVLQAMRDVVPNRYLFGPQRKPVPPGMRHVVSWERVAEAVLKQGMLAEGMAR